jgi:hypothetical protein
MRFMTGWMASDFVRQGLHGFLARLDRLPARARLREAARARIGFTNELDREPR